MPETGGARKYQVIASALRAAIQRGEYAPGTRLPGENDIMRDYEVARMTARQAVAVLVNEGLAVPRKGAGVYVREFRPIVGEAPVGGWASLRGVSRSADPYTKLGLTFESVAFEGPLGRIRASCSIHGISQKAARALSCSGRSQANIWARFNYLTVTQISAARIFSKT